MIKDYIVCGLPGSGVNFVAAFLDVEHKSDTATLRIDIDKEYAAQFDKGTIHTQEKWFKSSHNLCIDNDNKYVIKIFCKDMSETLKIIYNNYCSKRFNFEKMPLVELLDKLLCNSEIFDLSKWQDNHIKLWARQRYNSKNINKANCILNYQDLIFSNYRYKIFEKILKFEYNNNLIQKVSGKMRAWSIDDITEDNWQEFLEENLCPTNYS